MVTTANRPSVAQLRLHHMLARRLGWSDRDRRQFLERQLGHASSKELTRGQLADVIDWQQYALGLRPDGPRWRPQGPTSGQRALVERFARLPCPTGWHTHPARSVAMMQRLAGRRVEGLDELTVREASKFIEFLKAVFKRSRARAGKAEPRVTQKRSVCG